MLALGCSAAQITDAGLKVIGECKEMKFLGLNQNNITDEGLKHLKGLKNLISVELSS